MTNKEEARMVDVSRRGFLRGSGRAITTAAVVMSSPEALAKVLAEGRVKACDTEVWFEVPTSVLERIGINPRAVAARMEPGSIERDRLSLRGFRFKISPLELPGVTSVPGSHLGEMTHAPGARLLEIGSVDEDGYVTMRWRVFGGPVKVDHISVGQYVPEWYNTDWNTSVDVEPRS